MTQWYLNVPSGRKATEGVLGVAVMMLLVFVLDGVVSGLGLPLPSPVLAMALLTVLFAWIKRVPGFIAAGSGYLFRVFPLLFIPPLVATVELGDLLAQAWIALLLVVTLSTFMAIFVSALTYRHFSKRGRRGH